MSGKIFLNAANALSGGICEHTQLKLEKGDTDNFGSKLKDKQANTIHSSTYYTAHDFHSVAAALE